MTATPVTARVPGKEGTDNLEDREVTVDYDFGDTLEEAVEKFGAEVVYSKYKAETVINLQGLMRNYLKTGKTEEEISDLVDNWAPGVKTSRGKSKEEKLKELFAGLSADERQAFIEANL